MRRFLFLFLAATAGCATAQPEGGSKALLKWSAAEEKKEDDDKPKKPEPIVSDRPDFTEASSTVGKDHIQVEAGYSFVRDRSAGVTTQMHSYPEALFRVGMFADWFEWRIATNYGSQRISHAATPVETLTGGQDLYVGSKIALTEQSNALPETAVIFQATLPTGRRGFTAGRIQPGINYLFGWEVIPDSISLGGSFQGNATRDDDGHSYLTLANSVTVGYTLTEKLSAYTEAFAFYPHGATAAGVGPEYYFNAGFAYKVSDDFQLDIRAGVGLNKRADDFFTGAGFAYRY